MWYGKEIGPVSHSPVSVVKQSRKNTFWKEMRTKAHVSRRINASHREKVRQQVQETDLGLHLQLNHEAERILHVR